MSTTQSDTCNEANQSHKTTVREFLRENGEVASKDEIRAGTDVPAWCIYRSRQSRTDRTGVQDTRVLFSTTTSVNIKTVMTVSPD